MIDEDEVKVFSAQMHITVCRFDFEDARLHLQDRDIKGTTSEIANSDNIRPETFYTTGEGGCCRFIDDIEPGNLSSVFCRLPLGIGEVCR
jgi:hypothetical protein